MPRDLETQPETAWEKLTDAAGWLTAAVWTTLINIPYTIRRATPGDRWGLLFTVLLLGASAVQAVMLGGVLPWVVVAFLIGILVADLIGTRARIAERSRQLRLLESRPGGAPRVATLACSEHGPHRFVYGPKGWENHGPAN